MPDFSLPIRDAYLEILQRAPDPGGLAHFNERMNQGLREADLREVLLRSEEYAQRNPDVVAGGVLGIHPQNPHYFQDQGTGRPVLIASYANIVPTATNFDYVAQIEEYERRHIRYCRVWHFLPFEGTNAIWPWERSGGIRAQIHIFDRVGLSPASDERWGNNPWAADNNINDLEVPRARPPQDGTPDFYFFSSKPNLRAQQERYVRKLIDETIRFPNVHYEIENEHWEDDRPDWAVHYGQFVKDHIVANHPGTPRLVSYSSLEQDLESLYAASAIDVINKHFGNEAETQPEILNAYIEPRWPRNKPINIDEFANGVTDTRVLREMSWTILASGGHFHIEDAVPSADPFGVVENIRLFLEQSFWEFVRAAPDRGLITSGGGYCIAQPGAEYVCYFPRGGAKRLRVAPGDYREEWWNPRDGGFVNQTIFFHPGGDRDLATPDGNDWVLHIVK